MKRGHELLAKTPYWTERNLVSRLRETERLVELDHKLSAILGGQARPADGAEMLDFAQLCHDKNLHGASARLWAEAFRTQPKLADDMDVQNRYNAACDAAMAGSGQGKDDPPLDDEKKARWRQQAIDWLKADLTAWSKILESGPPQARQSISRTIQHWKARPDLAGLRDASALAKLPEDEQKACRRSGPALMHCWPSAAKRHGREVHRTEPSPLWPGRFQKIFATRDKGIMATDAHGCTQINADEERTKREVDWTTSGRCIRMTRPHNDRTDFICVHLCLSVAKSFSGVRYSGHPGRSS